MNKNVFGKVGFACVIFTSIYNMDHTVIPNETMTKEVIINHLATNNLQFCDHNMICSLAINKDWERLLIKTAVHRKNLLIQQILLLDEKLNVHLFL